MTPTPHPSPTPPRKRFDEAFKRSAVEHWLASGKKARLIAAELGVSVWNLRDWHKRYGPPPPPAPGVVELQEQVRALKAELLRAQQQRDILKKTLGILAEAPTNASNA
jgi:transposase-like protein